MRAKTTQGKTRARVVRSRSWIGPSATSDAMATLLCDGAAVDVRCRPAQEDREGSTSNRRSRVDTVAREGGRAGREPARILGVRSSLQA
ncbi:hypothetical protein GCM10023215_39460 [Pseudonocardia yuanmonensis]|uniref:Uncharacterized protein n=1 Tax=Pseudonocardia yuanmonensis TaxID=1095914 RepID=A0ABP8WY57_9PSEU